MGFLSEVVADVRRTLADRPLDRAALHAQAVGADPPRGFANALRRGRLAVVAEVKRASPSAGPIAVGADPVAQARAYVRGGASAISVLTEATHFGGSLSDLQAVRGAVDLPVLRKDFLVDASQLLESRVAGADAVLVIAAAVDDAGLRALLEAARELDLGVLLEAHTDQDLERALATDAEVIGVNARDLDSLEVDVDAALARIRRVPRDRIAVFESGIETRGQVEAAVEAGASAILVGETLMRAADPAGTLRALLGKEPRAR